MDYFIGIDVSKKTLDLAVVKDGVIVSETKIENQGSAIKSFVKNFINEKDLESSQLVVCMEHTGIYNAIALEVFHKKGIRVSVEPALRIKQSQGMARGKTDKMDARRIAVYAYKNQRELVFWKPQRLVIQKMRALLSLRQRLLKAKGQFMVPLREAVDYVDRSLIKELNQCNKAVLNGIQKSLKEVDDQLAQIMEQDPLVKTQAQQITSVPGLGRITAANMIAVTDEFTRINDPKKFACYAGVAPFEHSSGTSIRGRSRVSNLANMTLKKLLHLSAMSATMSNPELKEFYRRKVAEGKNKMSVINAVRNKLIARAFACVNQGRLYQIKYQNALA